MSAKTVLRFGLLLLLALVVGCSPQDAAPPTGSASAPAPTVTAAHASMGPTVDARCPGRVPSDPPYVCRKGSLRTPTPSGSASETPAPQAVGVRGPLPPFKVDLTVPFSQALPRTWEPAPYQGRDFALPISISKLANPHVLDGLTPAQRAFLFENGFVVIRSGEPQFMDIRIETASRTGQPFFLTTDTAYHALHLLFDDTLKAVERQLLRPQMLGVLQATRDQVGLLIPSLEGTSLLEDAQLADAYLSVALTLLEPSSPGARFHADEVDEQVQQVLDANGRANSSLFPWFEDDYGAYKPVGHYAGDPVLEQYFRGMTWLGRVHFALDSASEADFAPSRVPLVITYALRRATVGGKPASEEWASINTLLDFVIGPTDDAGPPEYAALMDEIYGTDPSPSDLANEGRWEQFQASAMGLPSPQINSTFVDWMAELGVEKGWRFMGQRFTVDANIFQNLIFDRVLLNSRNERREVPTGLDVMAAFGSEAALDELERGGNLEYRNYPENLKALQAAALGQPVAQWLSRFYSAWLYSFFPVLSPKDDAFPGFMQTDAWGFKDLNAALGSWAELKHDTILYTKMAEAAGGGGPPMSDDAPSYVEPNPEAFFRMAYAAHALALGLEARTVEEDLWSEGSYSDLSLGGYLYEMRDLGDRLEVLGAIAATELAGGEPTGEERWAITGCLGLHECTYTDSPYNRPEGEMPEVPIVAAVAGAGDSVLEVGTGYVDRLYVVVPLEGKLEVAQGGVFSYYEFIQPRNQRLTDEEWRARLDADTAPGRPSWTQRFALEGGKPAEWLAFRVGDIYVVTDAGDKLNLRESPSTKAPVLGQLKPGDFVAITEGPVAQDGYTWWKIACEWCDIEGDQQAQGWVVENQDWYVRSYLP